MKRIDTLDILSIKKNAEKLNTTTSFLRNGQALYLAAFDMFPVATSKLDKTEYDCFYEDSRMEKFLLELQTMDAE